MSDTAHPALGNHLIRYTSETFPEIIVRAKGSWVWDSQGKAILDFTSGQMCSPLGHNHPAIVEALKSSADTAIHLFSGMIPDTVADLAERMAAILPAPLSKSMFVNTGGEANEAAIKIAKFATGGYETVALGGSWHGAGGGGAAVSMASDRKNHGPTMPGVYAIPEPNAYRCPVEHCRDACDLTCMKIGFRMLDMQWAGAPAAVIAEPILSAGGVIVPPEGYFKALRQECEARGLMLIFDEAQTAFGRIGEWFAADGLGVTPDIMAVSKTLGGGIPLAATITSDAIEETAYQRGFSHYTSHVSDPLPAAVGVAVLQTIESENLIERAKEMGGYLRQRMLDLQQKYEVIGDVRGQGLLIGVELVEDREARVPYHKLGARTTERCLELGLSMNIRRRPERGSVWRIAPPLTVTRDEIDTATAILDQALGESLDAMAREC
ncbi:MAG: aspartate aminotransferase family protein [Proteobacteria bacterium]|nr:aspartate aminotransferase family protein [Pseudomonadota bacterium]